MLSAPFFRAIFTLKIMESRESSFSTILVMVLNMTQSSIKVQLTSIIFERAVYCTIWLFIKSCLAKCGTFYGSFSRRYFIRMSFKYLSETELLKVHKYIFFEGSLLDTTSNITQLRLSVFIFALSNFSFWVIEQALKTT